MTLHQVGTLVVENDTFKFTVHEYVFYFLILVRPWAETSNLLHSLDRSCLYFYAEEVRNNFPNRMFYCYYDGLL